VDFFANHFHNYHVEHHVIQNVPSYYLKFVHTHLSKYNQYIAPERVLNYNSFYKKFIFRLSFCLKDMTHMNINEQDFFVPPDFFENDSLLKEFSKYITSADESIMQKIIT